MRRRLATLPLVVAVALGLFAPASAPAANGMEVAVQDDPVLLSRSYYDRERALQQARAMGATRIRVNMVWAGVANDPGAKHTPETVIYNWRPYDELIDAAARYGMRIQLTLTGPAPAYATYNLRRGVYGPKPKAYGAFARAAVRHFKGRVDRYAIWNEPNYISWMSPFNRGPALYRELYKAAYKEIKRGDKRAAVFIGETAPYSIRRRSMAPLQFLRDVTCAEGRGTRLRKGLCSPLRADGYAHHPYDYRHKPNYKYRGRDNVTLGTMSRLTGTLRALRRINALRTPKGKQPPVYLTEYGYFQSGKYALGEEVRSSYLRRAYAMAQRNRHVKQMLQFGFVEAPVNFPGAFFDLSVIRGNGTPTASYEAIRSWAATARIKQPGGPITLPAAPASRR